jgi:hypothetical protein
MNASTQAYAANFEHVGFTIESVKEKAMQLMESER